MYAIWKKAVKLDTYKIEFNANGGKGTMKDQIITYGKNTPLTANKFTKDGYYFVGWKAWRSQDNKWYGYDKNKKLGWYKKEDIKDNYIYKDKIGVSKTTNAGTYAIMYAVWEKSSTKLDVTAVRTTTFTVESQGNNCYKITAPTVANYWSVEVKYRSTTASSFEKNKYM